MLQLDFAPNDMASLQDGKIVVVGGSSGPDESMMALARLNPDGSVDESFADGQIVKLQVGIDQDSFRKVALDSAGRIVAAGVSFYSIETGRDAVVMRFDVDGLLDESFGEGGSVVLDHAGGSDDVYALSIQPDGKILAGGRGGRPLGLARLNSDGSLDSSFGNAGTINDDLGQSGTSYITQIELHPSGRILLAARLGGYHALLAYTNPSATSTFVDETARFFDLHPNYPNPFNPTTTISYSVPVATHVVLTVHDVLGREVARLVDTTVPAGQHKLTWKATDLPSGLYVCRIEAGSYFNTRAVTLLR